MKITTRKIKATNTRGERIRATVARIDRVPGMSETLTVCWDYGSNHPHKDTAEHMARILHGPGKMVVQETGWTATGYVFEITFV